MDKRQASDGIVIWQYGESVEAHLPKYTADAISEDGLSRCVMKSANEGGRW
jgi:hypothetical protein